jgi:hypothetical protein
MMLNLELDQASERRLGDEARKRGLTLEKYAALLLQVMVRTRPDPAEFTIPFSLGATDEEWERELDDWIESQDASVPPIPDEALRRESLYEDRP